jgi:hypothetical protein
LWIAANDGEVGEEVGIARGNLHAHVARINFASSLPGLRCQIEDEVNLEQGMALAGPDHREYLTTEVFALRLCLALEG